MARAAQGRFLLRIEDIDQSRARPEWEAQILDDLTWLGAAWDAPPVRQSNRMKLYTQAIDIMWESGMIYPCHCTRRDIADALSAPQEGAAMHGPDGLIYPGTCRALPRPMARPKDQLLRLALTDLITEPLSYTETGAPPRKVQITPDALRDKIGDIVLARRDMGTSYHLSVVLDDAAMGITHVIRGEDLSEATAIHVALQKLLGLPTPIYHHHRLIRDDTGKRLAKRDDARAIAKYRADGASPKDIRQMVGLS